MPLFKVTKRVFVEFTVDADSHEEAEQLAADTSFLDFDWCTDGEEVAGIKEQPPK